LRREFIIAVIHIQHLSISQKTFWVMADFDLKR